MSESTSPRDPVATEQPQGGAAWATLVVIGAVTLMTGGLLTFAAMPTARVQAFIDARSPHGHTRFFSAAVPEMRHRAAVAGILAAVLLVALVILRAPVRRYISDVLASIAPAWSDLRQGCGKLWATDRGYVLVVLLLTLHGAAIRLAFINQPMRCDESLTYTYAHSSLLKAAVFYPSPNNQVLNTLMVGATTRVLGGEPWAIRVPAFILGVLLIPATFLAVRSLFGSLAGCVAAGLISSDAYMELYSVNARGYSLICLVCLLGAVLCCYVLRTGRRIAWVLLALLCALGLYTIPTMTFACAIGAVWLGLSIWREDLPAPKRRFYVDLGVALGLTGALTALLYLPILLVGGLAPLTDNRFVRQQPWDVFFPSLVRHTSEFIRHSQLSIPFPLVLALAALSVLALVFHRKIARQRVPIALAAVIAITLFFAYRHAAPYPRVWIFVLPFYFGLAGAGLAVILNLLIGAPQYRVLACVALVLAACAVTDANVLRSRSPSHFDDTEGFEDGPAITEFFATNHLQGGRLLVAYPGMPVIDYYFHRAGIDETYLGNGTEDPRPYGFVLVDTPLNEFNPKLSGLHVPDLHQDQMIQLHAFTACTLYKLTQPLTPDLTSPVTEPGPTSATPQ